MPCVLACTHVPGALYASTHVCVCVPCMHAYTHMLFVACMHARVYGVYMHKYGDPGKHVCLFVCVCIYICVCVCVLWQSVYLEADDSSKS